MFTLGSDFFHSNNISEIHPFLFCSHSLKYHVVYHNCSILCPANGHLGYFPFCASNKGAMNILVNIHTHLSSYILTIELPCYRVGIYLISIETTKEFFKMVLRLLLPLARHMGVSAAACPHQNWHCFFFINLVIGCI